MQQEADRARCFTRRALFVGGAQVAFFGALAARLYHLQVERSADFALLAEDNRANQRLLVPPRGRIVVRLGRPLARNVPTYRMLVIREQARELRPLLERLAALVTLEPDRIAAVLEESRVRRAFVPLLVREDLSWDEVARVAIHSPELQGAVLDSSLLRDYPEGSVLAHVLGHVGAVNPAEQAADQDPLLQLPEFRIGKSGIERRYDAVLRGRAGQSRVEVNATGARSASSTGGKGPPAPTSAWPWIAICSAFASRACRANPPPAPWSSTCAAAGCSPWPRCRASSLPPSPGAGGGAAGTGCATIPARRW